MKNFLKKENSFTLVEILVVVGILAAITGFGFVELANFKSKHSFDIDSENITDAIRSAQSKAIQQEGGTAWGIRFINSGPSYSYQIFQGSSYATSSVVTSEPLSSATIYTNPAPNFYIDLIFSSRTGLPSSGNGVSIVIRRKGGNEIYTIMVSRAGRISRNYETGPVVYWPMDESSGTTTYDSSWYGNNGTMYSSSAPTYILTSTGCRVGSYCGSFNGTNQYIKTSNNLDLSGTSALTVSMWVKFTTTSTVIVLEHSTNSNSNNAFMIVTKDQGMAGGLEFGDHNSGYNIVYTSKAYNDGNWHNLIVTSDRSLDALTQTNLYVDGVKDSVLSSAYRTDLNGNYSNFTAYFASRAGSSLFFGGAIDDVRIYNRAFSATEVQNLYNSY